MHRIFISYSSYDADLAEQIAGDLRCAGYEPWIARQSVRAGNPIVANIDAAIMTCHHFVVVLSQKALESEWVNQEITEGLWQKLSGRRRKHIIPALKESCVVPLHLQHIRHADFTNGYAVGFAQIYAAIDLPPAEDRWPADLVPADQLVLIENDTKDHSDHIRFACAHTIWSIRPDRAKPFLQNQLGDWRDYVNRHASLLLERYF